MAETATKKTPAKKVAAKTEVKKTPEVQSDAFAVIKTGGKQYIVSVGDVLNVELLGEHEDGAAIEFDQVLMTDNGKSSKVGTPLVVGAKVKATYLGHKKGTKLTILRFKAKSNRSRKLGHRQQYSQIRIESI